MDQIPDYSDERLHGKAVYDEGHAVVLAREARRDLELSALQALKQSAGEYFSQVRQEIEAALPPDALTATLELSAFPLGTTDAGVSYRQWCLDERLFLNPLNDLGPYPIAASDILASPSIVAPIGEGPRFHGFFNQIKQEFCSARWLAYEAMNSTEAHFSDGDVLLHNTLHYPSYPLATEKLKLAASRRNRAADVPRRVGRRLEGATSSGWWCSFAPRF